MELHEQRLQTVKNAFVSGMFTLFSDYAKFEWN